MSYSLSDIVLSSCWRTAAFWAPSSLTRHLLCDGAWTSDKSTGHRTFVAFGSRSLHEPKRTEGSGNAQARPQDLIAAARIRGCRNVRPPRSQSGTLALTGARLEVLVRPGRCIRRFDHH